MRTNAGTGSETNMTKLHIAARPVNQTASLPIFTVPSEFAPTWEHPADLLKKILGLFPRAERRVIDVVRDWLTRPGCPTSLTLLRQTLAEMGECCPATVSRAFARAREHGLLDIQQRWRKSGNLWLQISNRLRLPLTRPKQVPPELRKSSTQTRKQEKRTLNKVADGTFKDPDGILAKWLSRGPPPPAHESG